MEKTIRRPGSPAVAGPELQKAVIVSTKNARVAFLTNFVPPYRAPVLRELSAQVGTFRTFVSTKMEANRSWVPDWSGLDVQVQKNLSFKKLDRHPSGYTQETYLHVPYDTLSQLVKFQPHVVISGELGPRTIQSVLYRMANSSSRLIIHADLSEHTELGRGRAKEMLRGWMLKAADAVLVNGASGARYAMSLGVPETKIFPVPYATDTSIYADIVRTDDPSDVIKLLYVGQLIERKGIAQFVHVLVEWAKKHPTQNLELRLIGDGPLRDVIRAILTPTNLKIDMNLKIEYSDMPQAYAQADLLVLPTLADSWGLVVNEAMAAGLPILGSIKSQAVEELVKDGENGWVFDPAQRDAVNSALERALFTPREVIKQFGGQARKLAVNLNAGFAAEQTLKAIEFCLAGCE